MIGHPRNVIYHRSIHRCPFPSRKVSRNNGKYLYTIIFDHKVSSTDGTLTYVVGTQSYYNKKRKKNYKDIGTNFHG